MLYCKLKLMCMVLQMLLVTHLSLLFKPELRTSVVLWQSCQGEVTVKWYIVCRKCFLYYFLHVWICIEL